MNVRDLDAPRCLWFKGPSFNISRLIHVGWRVSIEQPIGPDTLLVLEREERP